MKFENTFPPGGDIINTVTATQSPVITKEYLRAFPNHIFVFGDNTLRRGYGGAAALRDEPNTYGFITKIYPDNNDASFYRPETYRHIFEAELQSLKELIEATPNNIYLISQIGAGLANKYQIWEKVIKDGLEFLRKYKNVVYLYTREIIMTEKLEFPRMYAWNEMVEYIDEEQSMYTRRAQLVSSQEELDKLLIDIKNQEQEVIKEHKEK
ncbi:MAG TPA: hypothetical protein VI911_11280 [Patescibacteria group bacterium]|nr:hypothetical protein [Patescibacteria group bacterium]